MKNALILHGTNADHTQNWFSYLEKELINLGYSAWVPDLPRADQPNIERYNEFLMNSDFVFNDETIIVGHSSGAVEILGLFNDKSFTKNLKVKACFLVGAFKEDLGWESLKGMVADFNYELIKERSSEFIFIHSDNDPYCLEEDARDLCKKLGGKFIELPGQGHFTASLDPKYTEFPELIKIIKQEI